MKIDNIYNKEKITMNLLSKQFEEEAIERIRKFARLAGHIGFKVSLGFSGGKDSQVVYDLCKRSGIDFTAYFNHSFESCETMNFIKKFYPKVIWRRDCKVGFIDNIDKHKGLLPTVQIAYCCENYKHNPKYIDDASIVGVRRAESQKRKARKVFEVKNKRFLRQHDTTQYFSDICTGTGSVGKIQLKPIVDWTDEDVWNYINDHNLPINPEYERSSRVGCLICPKASLERNFTSLMRFPKLIDAIIRQREKHDIDWLITNQNTDYSENKALYIIYWLNHSFMPFTKKQEHLANEILKEYYDKACKRIKNEQAQLTIF